MNELLNGLLAYSRIHTKGKNMVVAPDVQIVRIRTGCRRASFASTQPRGFRAEPRMRWARIPRVAVVVDLSGAPPGNRDRRPD